MREATQEEVEEAIPQTITEATQREVERALSNYEDPEIDEDGTFNLEDPNGEPMTDGGSSYIIDEIDEEEGYAVVEMDGETYLLEEVEAGEDMYVFDVIDKETVCRPESSFESPDRVRASSYDDIDESYEDVVDAAVSASNILKTGEELNEISF